MKQRILSIMLIILVVNAAVAVVYLYHSQKAQAYLAQTRQNIAAATHAKAEALIIENEKARLKYECQKETTYYDSLTAKQKATVEAPNCANTQLVE